MARRLFVLLAAVAGVIGLATSCTPAVPTFGEQMADLDHLTNSISYDQFVALKNRPDKAPYGYMDWSTDGCSAGPIGGSPYGFTDACYRHDFSWRNLKRIKDPSGNSRWNERNKWVADQQFLEDMKFRCEQFNVVVKPTCIGAAEGYYRSVRLITPYASDQTLNERPSQFSW